MSDQEPELLWHVEGEAGLIVLNRPAALNALTLEMVRLMEQALDAFEQDPRVTRVIVTGAGAKAFCAGGDIRKLYEAGRAGDHESQLTFWREEYLLNMRIKTYPKPYIALIDGIVMGGGVGVSQHGHYRVAGDKYLFAMPEVGIGFFPDVGATYFLPRLPDRFGWFVGLTGARVKAGDAVAFGLADVYVPSADLPALRQTLIDGAPVEASLKAASRPAPAGELAALWPKVRNCFQSLSIADCLACLEADPAQAGAAVAADLRRKSPFSVALTAEQLRQGQGLAQSGQDIADAMQIEYRLVSRIIAEPDFYEGIRAAIVDRDQTPQWRHARIEDVPQAEIMAMFQPGPVLRPDAGEVKR